MTSIPQHSPTGTRITALATNAVTRFLEERVDETALRSLGVLLVDEADTWDRSASELQSSPAMNLMTRFIETNLRRRLTVRAIASSASVSTATAERLFARYTGHSVLAWVRGRRMKEAALLLQSTNMNVREVADRVGFSDPFYFSRVFAASFGTPPSRYADSVLRHQ